ncbi:ABC transporter permease [Actinotalea sp. K2]|uniref:ABC transporter permease n=1 Tax=Actinotalea sp. K2 TaxID=2939438 RepID=UPI0020180402|nr:ABC transporter permease [Actinotalea sp. K2]MCL3862081.1 ABC transporter permease [Actinotalea sp. K2]
MTADVHAERAATSRRPGLAALRGRNNEGVLAGVILLLLLVMLVVEPSALTWGFAGDIIRSGLVTLALALGLLLIIISGGMDVSFTAIAVFSGYATVRLMTDLGIDGRVWPFLLAAAIGCALGSLNAVLVARYRMETLIASLGTQVIIRGFLLAFVGSTYLATLPPQLDSVGTTTIFRLGSSPVNIVVVPVALACVALALILRRTMFGRGVYAVGGDKESARRVGFHVARVQTGIYLLAGLFAGFAGMVHVVLSRHASPFDLVGMELNVIAAVVIGGALDRGGRGSVHGTVLGVLLVSLVQNSLVRLGISSYWHVLVIGLVILVGVAIQARSNARGAKRPRILEEVTP